MSFKFFGIRIRLGFFFFLSLALAFYFDTSGLIGLSLLCAAAHEGGHIAAMLLCGIQPQSMELCPFGAYIHCPAVWFAPLGRRVLIYLAGPAINCALCLAAYFFHLSDEFFSVNLALAFFNLLPILPLDGANALNCLLCRLFGDTVGNNISEILSIAVLLPAGVGGFMLLLRSKYNYSLLITVLYLCVMFTLRRDDIRSRKGKGFKNVS